MWQLAKSAVIGVNGTQRFYNWCGEGAGRRTEKEWMDRNRNRNRENKGLSGPCSSMTSLAQLSNSTPAEVMFPIDDGLL